MLSRRFFSDTVLLASDSAQATTVVVRALLSSGVRVRAAACIASALLAGVGTTSAPGDWSRQ